MDSLGRLGLEVRLLTNGYEVDEVLHRIPRGYHRVKLEERSPG